MKQENYIRGMIMIILSAFFFACMNVSVRLAGDLPSVQKSFFRNLVAAFFAAIILIKSHTAPKVEKTQWGSLFLRCAFGTLGILCNFYAIDHLLVADASILNKLSPFFAIIFSFLLLKEKIKPAQAMCVILAFVGCLFVVKPGFENVHLIPGAYWRMRRTGCRNRIYNGAEDGYTRSKGTGHCVLFFLLFLYYCDTVDRISLSADVTAAVVDAASCGTFCSGRTVYDHRSIYLCTRRKNFYF